MTDITISNATEQHRYEAFIDGQLAGYCEYNLLSEAIMFTHTEVLPSFEGQGVGSAIARAALDDVRASAQRQVLPLCPFISTWIGKHPDYQDLVHGAPRSTATD